MDNAINTVSGYTGTQPAAKKPSSTLDKTAFLQLLVAQLKNQDPNSAQDSAQMVQQMTSYASLEQMQNMNDALKGLQVQNVGLFQAQASNLVGKQIRVGSNDFQLKDGKARIGVELPTDARVTLTIKDATGRVIRVLDQGDLKAGSQTLAWDGRDTNGVLQKDGAYGMEVSALDPDGKPVKATPTAYARVESVIFEGGSVFVIAGGRKYSLSDVSEIAA